MQEAPQLTDQPWYQQLSTTVQCKALQREMSLGANTINRFSF